MKKKQKNYLDFKIFQSKNINLFKQKLKLYIYHFPSFFNLFYLKKW
jgi:hypothetical protein